MRRPVRRLARPRIRAELDATAVPTWRPPRIATADAASLHFVLSPGRLPRGRRVYAIGDIHGCLAELRQLHAAIADDLARRPAASAVLVHLGDYIDFGPDSAGVVALLAAGPPIAGLPTINLMGDHERTALDALSGDGAAATDWLHIGGQAALDSWGIAGRHAARRMAGADSGGTHRISCRRSRSIIARATTCSCMPASDRAWRSTDQAEDDMLGIRQSFLASEQDFGAVIVHGHSASPVADDQAEPHRHRHRRGQWRQTHLRGVRGRCRRFPRGVTGRPSTGRV